MRKTSSFMILVTFAVAAAAPLAASAQTVWKLLSPYHVTAAAR